ncbi:MAG: flagellar motor switch protein FliN [Syntrophotalea acetylenica]|jgi:flagellar motor switch protein FliN/FliY|uniref:flagellar motor switch protein FliN n=1 Tax=Syntrophotalea TaxID=2812025 RepID=UPI00092FEEB6|nr:flagellar motor switch protein FliN [Syntrophotalea acetylenica]MDD4457070.1 flagellar motor switch protein FliN [Syntrophotalea acetylenica]MDY0261522.1 flagellar motor switch protein FliN [Syntrophotalea acetylenica]
MPTEEKVQNNNPPTSTEIRDLGFLLDIPLEVSVEIGSTRMPIKDLLQLQEGSIIELDKLAGEPLDLYVNSRLIARGEAVMVKDRYGLRLTDVVSPAERLENLG